MKMTHFQALTDTENYLAQIPQIQQYRQQLTKQPHSLVVITQHGWITEIQLHLNKIEGVFLFKELPLPNQEDRQIHLWTQYRLTGLEPSAYAGSPYNFHYKL